MNASIDGTHPTSTPSTEQIPLQLMRWPHELYSHILSTCQIHRPIPDSRSTFFCYVGRSQSTNNHTAHSGICSSGCLSYLKRLRRAAHIAAYLLERPQSLYFIDYGTGRMSSRQTNHVPYVAVDQHPHSP